MQLDSRATERLTAMVSKGERLLETYRRPPDNFIGFEGWVDADLFAEWRSQSLSLLRQLLGREHTYSTSFEEGTEKPAVPSSVQHGLGVLRAASDDLSNGHLFDARNLIAAEVFADFVAMARHLLEQGYKDPAASLVGAVLEDGLRRIADANSVSYSKADGLDSLNQKLVTSNTYTRLVHSRIDTWRIIRNAADHGHFGDYTSDDVGLMIEGTADVLERLLA